MRRLPDVGPEMVQADLEDAITDLKAAEDLGCSAVRELITDLVQGTVRCADPACSPEELRELAQRGAEEAIRIAAGEGGPTGYLFVGRHECSPRAAGLHKAAALLRGVRDYCAVYA